MEVRGKGLSDRSLVESRGGEGGVGEVGCVRCYYCYVVSFFRGFFRCFLV